MVAELFEVDSDAICERRSLEDTFRPTAALVGWHQPLMNWFSNFVLPINCPAVTAGSRASLRVSEPDDRGEGGCLWGVLHLAVRLVASLLSAAVIYVDRWLPPSLSLLLLSSCAVETTDNRPATVTKTESVKYPASGRVFYRAHPLVSRGSTSWK